jgi:hypothetical protein
VPDIDLPTLKSLLARVEGATGADRNIDRDVMALFYERDRRYIGCRCDPSCCPGSAHLDDVWVDPTTNRWKTTATDGYEFTASLDAVVQLGSLFVRPAYVLAGAFAGVDPNATLDAIARRALAALLKALISQEQSQNG